MATTISTLLDLARTETQVLSGARCSLRDVLGEIGSQLAADREVLVVDVPDLRLGVPHDLAVRAISPVVENAMRFPTPGDDEPVQLDNFLDSAPARLIWQVRPKPSDSA